MNLTQMQTYISARLIDQNNQSVSLDQITGSINESISYWQIRRFSFNEERSNITLTAQSGLITTPSNFLVPFSDTDGFALFYGNVRYPLEKWSAQQYDFWFLNNGYGQPWYYAKLANQYHVYPLPDQAYTLEMHFLKKYDPLVSSSDTNDFTDNIPYLICNWTIANLIAELRQDEKMETYFRSKANDEWKEQRVLSSKANATGSLQIYSTL